MHKVRHTIAIAIVAAMEREVAPLIRNWKVTMIEHSGQRYRLFENGNAAMICGGIGGEAARRATEAIIQKTKPERVLSVGFAGALDSSLRVGDVLEPRTIVNAADGVRTEVPSGEGILVSSTAVANKKQKTSLGKAYGALAVDMEAAAVAQGAQARGIDFAALKVISDSADFEMPAMDTAMDHFVASDGSFRSSRFACHVAVRPWLWVTTITLARNSSKASAALCGALANYLSREAHSEQFASAHTGLAAEAHTRLQQKQ